MGAGIGGLALAAALREAGVPCLVFEQSHRLAEVGAGLQLAPNAVRPLHRLGLGPALDTHAVRIEAMEFKRRTGRTVARTELGLACELLFGAPYYSVQRAHLHEALRGLNDPDALRLGHRLVHTEELDDRVRLLFADGTTHEADVVVGADGIHSVVREALIADRRVFSGLGVWRGLVPVARLSLAVREPRVRLWMGPGGHVVCYPVAAGELISFAATHSLVAPLAESWSATADPARLRGGFAGWDEAVEELFHAADHVRQWALHDREPLHRWATGRLTVLGDAAHPMLPFLAQGANQAIEDAMDLAACLARSRPETVPAALRLYQSLRAPRTTAIQRMSRDNAAALHLPEGPAQRERDDALHRSAALRNRAWLYAYETGMARKTRTEPSATVQSAAGSHGTARRGPTGD
ncbi:FAD-dependent monooxygenase [Streptomyces afghaniensis]|uniref:FAD-dependent monooxygenase n=1 Tax=Streptomyces afghaniensis TaxID=66865 RepID=UPI0033ACFE31